MNTTLSVLLSLSTVLAGGAAALVGDFFEPTTAPASDCLGGEGVQVCSGRGHGNETAGNETREPDHNETAEPDEPDPEPADDGNETGHYHHHHYHNGTADQNETAEPESSEEKPDDVHFCTNGLQLLDDGYTFSWDVYEGFEVFELDWHYQGMTFGLLSGSLHVELRDGAGNVVLSLDDAEAQYFHLMTEDLQGYAPGEWTFALEASEIVAEQGLVGTVEY